MFNFSFDPEQFASLGSSFDEPDPFAPTPIAPAPKKLPVAPEIVKAPVASVTPKQERVIAKGPAFVAPSAPVATKATPVKQTATDIVNFANNLQNTRQTAWAENGTGSYDANDWAQIAMATPEMEENYRWGTEQTRIWDNYQDDFKSYVEDNDIPLTEERDGVTYYLTTDEEGRNDQELGGNHANFLHGWVSDGVWIDQGPAGTYSTRYVDTSMSAVTGLLNNPVMSIGASLAGPLGVIALNAAKVANGQTLHGGDYASIALAGLEQFGVIKAPLGADEARKTGEVARGASTGMLGDLGDMTQELAAAGKGIGGLTYGQTVGLINTAATGDPKAFVYGEMGRFAVNKAFTAAQEAYEESMKGVVGFDPTETRKIAGIFQADDLQAGLLKVVDKVAGGTDFDKALAYGLGTYIREGGSFGIKLSIPDGFGNFNLPDLGILEDVVRAAGRSLEDVVRATGSLVDDKILQPVIKAVEPIGKQVESVVRETGRATDDAIIQPVRELAKDVDDAVFNPLGDKASELDTAVRDILSDVDTAARQGLSEFDDEVIQPALDVASDVDTAVRQELTKLDEGLYDIQSPFSTPEIDLPSIDLPNFNLPSLGMGMGMLLSGAPAPTATTGKIFENELFKFKNKIELTEFGPLNQPEQEVDIEDFLTSPFESAFTTSQRFA
jgi:hypothetical protein